MTTRSRAAGVLLALLMVCASTPVLAQADAPSDRAALFAYLVRNPGDVPATLRYAKLSHEAGDIEAAIGALERVLFFKPDEPNARLYLGILYGRLGSNDMARGYFESVLQHPATPEAIKQRATYLLGKATEKLNPHQWSVYVRTGLRWQSNANGEPDGTYTSYAPDYFGPGNGQWVTSTGNPQSDWNAYLNAGVAYSYDFGNQRGDRFEVNLTTYSTRQKDFDQYDYTSAELTFGPRFGIPTNHPTAVATIKPYLLFGGALLDEDEYYTAFGGGVSGTVPVGTWTLAPYADVVWRDYSDNSGTDDIFDPNDFEGSTGPVFSAGMRLSSDPYAARRFNLHLGYQRREVEDAQAFSLDGIDASENYLAFDRFIAELRLPFDINVKGHQLLVTPLIGFRWTQYDAPDPFVQAPVNGLFETIREDKQLRVGLAADYAINDWAGVGAQLFYTKTDSNLSAYDTDNLSISFGPHFRF